MANPGNMANHQAEKFVLAVFNIIPQLIVSSDRPMPKNDKVDSRSTVFAKPKDNTIKTGPRAFGKI